MANCAHCDVPILDETVQVVHGDVVYCCANCAIAMEQGGSGSDRDSLSQPDALRCSRCGTPIIDEQTMETRGDQAFCCASCAAVMAPAR